jgi:DNA-binding NarL/FixJ family response regulator
MKIDPAKKHDKPARATPDALTRVAFAKSTAASRRRMKTPISNSQGHICVCTCASAEDVTLGIPKQTTNSLGNKPAFQIIVLSAGSDVQMLFRALRAGGFDCVLKRIDEGEIAKALSKVQTGDPLTISRIAGRAGRAARDSIEIPLPNEMEQLSNREMEILALVADGCPNREIAARLAISRETVRTHLMRIFKKLRVHRRTEAAVKYLRTGRLSQRQP